MISIAAKSVANWWERNTQKLIARKKNKPPTTIKGKVFIPPSPLPCPSTSHSTPEGEIPGKPVPARRVRLASAAGKYTQMYTSRSE